MYYATQIDLQNQRSPQTRHNLILSGRVELDLAHDGINLRHDLWCQFLQNLQSTHVLDNLLGS